MRADRSHCGHTLFEVLVAVALFSVVATLVVDLFVSSARIYTRAESRLDTQAAALIALNQLTLEARSSVLSSLTVTDASQGVVACAFRKNAVAPVRQIGPVVADGFTVYWFDRGKNAIGRLYINKDKSVQRLTTTEIVTTISGAGNAHLIAYFVRDMTLALPCNDGTGKSSSKFPDASVRNPTLSITLTVCKTATPEPANPQETFSTSIVMRNKQ